MATKFPHGLESIENYDSFASIKDHEKQIFIFTVVHDEDVMPFGGQTHNDEDTHLPN